jgi:membrane-associated phospholipid phosphatase
MSPLFTLNRRWLWAGASVLVLLLILSRYEGLNLWLFRAGNSLSLYTGEWLWANITLFGDTLIVFVLLLPLVGRRPELIWSVILSACVAALIVHLGKEFIDSPRPAGVLSLDSLQLIGYVAKSSSFPSGHTAAAFTLAGTLALLPVARWWKMAALMLAALVGISRVAVGIHWPTDVFGGALAGWLGAAAGCYLAARLPFGVGLTGQRIQAVILVLLVPLMVVAHDGGYPQGRMLIILLPLLLLLLAGPGLKQLFSPQPRLGKINGEN